MRSVWKVEADQQYDVTADFAKHTSSELRPKGGTGLIACRTLDGSGRLCFDDGRVFDTRSGTLVIVSWGRLARYHTVGTRWHFWWFEFDTIGPFSLPCNTTMIVPVEPPEYESLEQILSDLRVEHITRRTLACARFQTLLFEWVARRTDQPHLVANQQRIQDVVTQMCNRLDGAFSIAEMARIAHLSEPHFRRIFREVTGYSPKKFYDRLRLTWAEHMLRTERKNVSEVARALGFCSSFHFSRVFRNYFGFPPSQLRRSKEE